MQDDNGRSSAFEALFQREASAVFAYARRRVAPDAAQDIVADTFLIAWRRREQLPDPALPWLLGVARNLLRRTHRDAMRDAGLLERLGPRAETHDVDAETAALGRHSSRVALSRLTTLDREAVLLVAWEGLSAPEAAQVVGCSTNAFHVRLSRARAKLDALLAEPDAHHPDRRVAPRRNDPPLRRPLATDPQPNGAHT